MTDSQPNTRTPTSADGADSVGDDEYAHSEEQPRLRSKPTKFEMAKRLFQRSTVPYLVGLLLVWFVGVFVVYPKATGVAVASDAWLRLFVLDSTHPEYYWTWASSILTHGGVVHLLVNSVVLFFAGISLEYHIGSRRFLAVFFVTALVASIVQVAGAVYASEPMVLAGASGGISGVFGALLTLEPDSEVRVFFIVPMEMWMALIGFIVVSLGAVAVYGVGAGGLGHLAHVGGLVAGIGYGVLRDPAAISRVTDAVRDASTPW